MLSFYWETEKRDKKKNKGKRSELIREAIARPTLIHDCTIKVATNWTPHTDSATSENSLRKQNRIGLVNCFYIS